VRPVLFQLGGVSVPSHEVFAALGILVAVVWTVFDARRVGRADRSLLFIVVGGLLGAAVFARFGLTLRYLQVAEDPSFAGLLRYGGRTLLGGLMGGYLGIVLTKRLIGYTRATGDLFVTGVAAGMAIGRVGCFLTERPGTVTDVPWAVRVPAELARLPQCPGCELGPMHPSFIYEIVFDLISVGLLIAFARPGRPTLPRWMVEGDVFRAFLLAYAVFRVGVEFVRGNPVMAYGMSGSQITAALSAIALAVYFAKRRLSFAPALAAERV
jgi:prolipoprotein diacylglyceryltransferase